MTYLVLFQADSRVLGSFVLQVEGQSAFVWGLLLLDGQARACVGRGRWRGVESTEWNLKPNKNNSM